MSILKPRNTLSGLREYTVLRCPDNGNQVSWCRQLCTPVGGQGTCGRLAPHALRGRTQRAIALARHVR